VAYEKNGKKEIGTQKKETPFSEINVTMLYDGENAHGIEMLKMQAVVILEVEKS
jgi:hypothetical protein